MLTVSPLATARLIVSVRDLSVALKAPMAVTLSGRLPEPTISSKALFDTPVVTRLPTRANSSTNWLPVAVAVVDIGGVLLVPGWFWKLLASVWAGVVSCITPESSLTVGFGPGQLTVTVSPWATARLRVRGAVLSAFARPLLTVMAALPVVPLATVKPALPGGRAVVSRPSVAVKVTTNWLPLTSALLNAGGVAGVLLVAAMSKEGTSRPSVVASCSTLLSLPGVGSV